MQIYFISQMYIVNISFLFLLLLFLHLHTLALWIDVLRGDRGGDGGVHAGHPHAASQDVGEVVGAGAEEGLAARASGRKV